MRFKPVLNAVLGAALAVTFASASAARAADDANPFTGDPDAIAEGKRLWAQTGCYACHGKEAGGAVGPDLTDDQWLNVDGEYESIVEVINTGVAQPIEALGSMLPRAGMQLTDEQVEALAAYAYMLSRM